MKAILTRASRWLHTRKGGLCVMAAALISTLALIGASGRFVRPVRVAALRPIPAPAVTPAVASSAADSVKLTAALSRGMVVQGEDGSVYLTVDVEAPLPQKSSNPRQKPADVIVVLDRSGSMSEAKKINFARAAIKDLLARMAEGDRIALVGFDSSPYIFSPLSVVNAETRERLSRLVDSINPGSGTNMSSGLDTALSLLPATEGNRSRRVLLLSDGQANEGDPSIEGLSARAAKFGGKDAVVSTIGLGLDFNETVLSSIAGRGMGNYSYLENLEGLGTVFAKDLSDSRSVFAAASTLEFSLSPGVQMVDAGGYSSETAEGGRLYRISLGQLLEGSAKHLTLSARVPTGSTGAVNLGRMVLNYSTDSGNRSLDISPERLALAVVEPSRAQDAIASVDASMLRNIWSYTNVGVMQKEFHDALSAGDKGRAQQAMDNYKNELMNEEKKLGVKLETEQLTSQLGSMQTNLDESFSGSQAEQDLKQKRYSKSIYSRAASNQAAKVK